MGAGGGWMEGFAFNYGGILSNNSNNNVTQIKLQRKSE